MSAHGCGQHQQPSGLSDGRQRRVLWIVLVINALMFALLTGFTDGDANMRSVWICARDDVLANLAVLLAAPGVFGTGTGWPDIVVAGVMASLALYGAGQVVRQALGELRASGIVQAAG